MKKQADVQNAKGKDDLTLAVERPVIAPYFPNMMFNYSTTTARCQLFNK
jgi:hypothetical protein